VNDASHRKPKNPDVVARWKPPFDKTLLKVRSLLNEVEEHDPLFDWGHFYEQHSSLFRFKEAIEAIAGGESCERLFDCFGDDAIVTREDWCGGGPGLSGSWIEVNIRKAALSKVHSAIDEIAGTLKNYRPLQGSKDTPKPAPNSMPLPTWEQTIQQLMKDKGITRQQALQMLEEW